MTDWRECRVVRDRYGDLWGRRIDDPNWVQVGEDMYNAEPARELERDCGPLTPILDRDGLPVVRTVGDLTARHIGRQVIVDGLHAVLGTLPWQDPDGVWRVGLNGYGEVCSLDEPCEVLP